MPPSSSLACRGELPPFLPKVPIVSIFLRLTQVVTISPSTPDTVVAPSFCHANNDRLSSRVWESRDQAVGSLSDSSRCLDPTGGRPSVPVVAMVTRPAHLRCAFIDSWRADDSPRIWREIRRNVVKRSHCR